MYGTLSEARPAHESHATSSLVTAYRDSSAFFFASTEETLLAQAEHAEAYVCRPWDHTLAGCVQESLLQLQREHGIGARAALALPFSRDEDVRGWLLRRVDSARGRAPAPLLSGSSALESQPGFSLSFRPTPREYLAAVERALGTIASGALEKVVVGRLLQLAFDDQVDGTEWLRRFYAQNVSGYVFAVDLAPPGGEPHKLMGASPELLLQKRGGTVLSNPLAGSRARGATAAEDRQLATDLLNSDKDRREHALVVEEVVRALAPFCARLDVPERPELLSTATMWHLSTKISGELHDPRCSSISLVEALHPTPAVAGYPRHEAVSLIAQLEGGSRGPFAGAVGHCDVHGDGDWAISLRCAELTARTALLFAGAGVVAGSDPRAELDETSAKFRTALRALGVPLLSGRS